MMLTLYRGIMALLGAMARFFPLVAGFVRERDAALAYWRTQGGQNSGAWWFHVSSVGELEQVRPVIEVLKQRSRRPAILTYFSSSVPRLVQKWDFVDAANFLPLDTRSSMHEFFACMRPAVLVLNRYDLWPEMLATASEQKVPIALVNASIPPLGLWGKVSIGVRRSLFARINAWTYVDAAAATAWEPYSDPHAHGLVTGNPRVDRALARAEEKRVAQSSELMQRLREYLGSKPAIVGGSVWAPDEELLLASLRLVRAQSALASTTLLLVPHEPTEEHVQELESRVAAHGFKSFRANPWPNRVPADAEVVIVNLRGVLAELYGLGKSAYVGGGFGKQVHSVIEPLAHGLSLSLGPKHDRMPEVQTLLAIGAAYVAQHPRKSAENLAKWLSNGLSGGERARKAQEALALFIRVHRGAGERIADFLLREWGGDTWKK